MPVHRLFVALYPPEEVRCALLGQLAALAIPELIPTPIEMLHLTLQFIGETDVRQLDEVRESVERSAAGIRSFELIPKRLMSLPVPGPSRLIACETDCPPALAEIRRRLVLRLARSKKQRSHDTFLPHLTLGRFASPQAGQEIDQPVSSPAFNVDAIHLVRSVLHPQGARHTSIAEFPLESA